MDASCHPHKKDLSYLPDATPCAQQTLDLYLPEGPGPFPLIIWIHGGGWHSGDKADFEAIDTFLVAGLALASLNYRLTSSGSPFPAQIEDCFCALTWLSEQAESYNLDPARTGVVGHSAGAHLAAMLAITQSLGLFSKDTGNERVQAAVLWSAPLDLDRIRGQWPDSTFPFNSEDPFCKTFFEAGSYDRDLASWASPTTHINSAASLPPMLITHGDEDTVVPWQQAKQFAKIARKRGVDVTFQLDTGYGHEIVPGHPQAAIRFFQDKLK